MNDDVPSFMLSCVDTEAPAPVLKGVEARGRLEGVLFEMTLRQPDPCIARANRSRRELGHCSISKPASNFCRACRPDVLSS